MVMHLSIFFFLLLGYSFLLFHFYSAKFFFHFFFLPALPIFPGIIVLPEALTLFICFSFRKGFWQQVPKFIFFWKQLYLYIWILFSFAMIYYFGIYPFSSLKMLSHLPMPSIFPIWKSAVSLIAAVKIIDLFLFLVAFRFLFDFVSQQF